MYIRESLAIPTVVYDHLPQVNVLEKKWRESTHPGGGDDNELANRGRPNPHLLQRLLANPRRQRQRALAKPLESLVRTHHKAYSTEENTARKIPRGCAAGGWQREYERWDKLCVLTTNLMTE